MKLNEKIHLLRKQNNMTQEQLAERLAVTRQTVSKWELSESEPDVAYIVQLSEIFQVTTDHLLKDVPNISPPASSSKRERSPRGSAKPWIGGIFTISGLLGVLTLIHISFEHLEFTIGDIFQYQVFWIPLVIGLIGLGLIFVPNFWEDNVVDEIKDFKESIEELEQDLKKPKIGTK